MFVFDYDAVIWEGDIRCTECLPKDIDVEDESISPIFAGSEWDYYPVCAVCGCVHEYITLLEND